MDFLHMVSIGKHGLIDNTAAVNVASLGCDLTVGILLNEFSVASVVQIGAFETLTVLGFLNGLAIALAMLVHATELIAIGKADNDLSIKQSVAETAIEDVAVLFLQHTLSVLLVIAPLLKWPV